MKVVEKEFFNKLKSLLKEYNVEIVNDHDTGFNNMCVEFCDDREAYYMGDITQSSIDEELDS